MSAFISRGFKGRMLSRPEGVENSGTSILYFKVEEIQAAYAELNSRRVRFVDEPHIIAKMDTYDLWMAFFKDSEDNMHAIMSEVPRK